MTEDAGLGDDMVWAYRSQVLGIAGSVLKGSEWFVHHHALPGVLLRNTCTRAYASQDISLEKELGNQENFRRRGPLHGK